MQMVLDTVDAISAPITQGDAQQAAQTYLYQQLGSQFYPNHGVRTQRAWRFLIQYQTLDVPRPLVVGRLDIDAQTSQITPLTSHEITLLQDRLAMLLADFHGTPPLASTGYISPAFARRNAKGYLGQHISIFAYPTEEVHWLAGDPPYWCVPVVWSQPVESLPCTLGVIQVNTQTGAVIPVTESQLQAMQRRIQDASPRPAHPTATAS